MEEEKVKEKSEKVKKTKPKKEESEKISEADFEKKVLELSKTGLTSEKIGETLRKQGIHSKDYSKRISQILKEKNAYVNPDLKNVEQNLERVAKHYGTNKQDKRSMREKDRLFSHLRRLKAYFKAQ
jgi:ribosomal protein S15P/S13E